jgi:hypothetical protein
MQDISQITYTSESGTILPELQWFEKLVVTRDKVTWTRNGKATATKVNAGTWDLPVDTEELAGLFEQLEAADASSIREVKAADPTDGGGVQTYHIVYAGNKTLSLRYAEGTTYTHGDLVTNPVAAFLKAVSFPPGAANRY